MNLSQTVKQLCKDLHVTTAELSRRMGQSQQNLGKKLKNETVGFPEFQKILEVLGVRFEYSITMPDGDTPKYVSFDEHAKEKIAVLEAQVELERRNLDYMKTLCREIRMSLYTITGNTDMALKHPKDASRVLDCLKKVKVADQEIDALLNEAISMSNLSAPEEAQLEGGDAVAADPDILKDRRVLMVEDNQMNRDITRDMLEDNGLVVEEAEDGAIAVKMVASSAPGYYDAILMDIMMPNMDGYEACRQIRKLPNRVRAGTPIIAMTANAFEEDRKRCFEAGMDAHIAKPVECAKLLSTLMKYV